MADYVKHLVKYGKYKITIPAILFAILAIYIRYLGPKESYIDAQLESGSSPRYKPMKVSIERPRELSIIREMFIMKESLSVFGVILGPSGTGKSYLTELACNMWPKGVLYHHIDVPSELPVGLAKTIGMKLKHDANVFELLMEKFGFTSYLLHYTLPKKFTAALGFVLKELERRAIVYNEKNHRIACLFIDGVDFLAKEQPQDFLKLVDLAKTFARNGYLRIVLVSSEGSVIPLLDNTTSKTRMGEVVEILDIACNDSEHYMTQQGIPVSLAKRIYNFTGGRFVHINQAIEMYRIRVELGLSEDDDIFDEISDILLGKYFRKRITEMNLYHQAHGEMILKKVLSAENNIIDPGEPFESVDEKNKSVLLTEAMKSLVKIRLLRYTARGWITWHSQVVQYGVSQMYGHNAG